MKISNLEYIRIGSYMAIVKDGYIDSLYRIDEPERIYKPKLDLTVMAAKMRNSRKKLECVLK